MRRALLLALLTACSRPDSAARDAGADVANLPDVANLTDTPDIADVPTGPRPPTGVRKLAFHGSSLRLGWNDAETDLTPAAVARGLTTAWSSPPLDAITLAGVTYPPHLYASPLYVDDLALAAGFTASAVIAATTNGYVYAVNAFATSDHGAAVAPGTILWRAHLAEAAAVPALDGGVPLGVLSTPIIDLSGATPTVYVTPMDAARGWLTFALDLRDGHTLPGWPVVLDNATLSAVNTNGPARFQDARVQSQRAALALSPDGGLLYVPFAAYSDGGVGWIAAIDTRAARLVASFSGAPSVEATAQGGIWGPGGAAVDAEGNVYATTGNSPAGSGQAPRTWGQSLLRWDPRLRLTGTFTPFNHCQMDVADTDLGGSSPVLFPLFDPANTATPSLIAFGGKQGSVYLLDRAHLPGRLDHRPPCSTDAATDPSLLPPGRQPQFTGRGPLNVFGPYSETIGNLDRAKMRSTPAYFRAASGEAFLFVTGSSKESEEGSRSIPPCVARLRVSLVPGEPAWLTTDATERETSFQSPGSPVVSSHGGLDPVVWVYDSNGPRTASLVGPAAPRPMLYAFDGTTMTRLWQTPVGSLPVGGKYSTPAVAHGLVFIGTDRIHAFGVRP